MPIPLSAHLAADHRYQAAYHARMAAEHKARGETSAATKHEEARQARESAAETPLDQTLGNQAAYASATADEASQRAGWRTVIRPAGRSGLEPPVGRT